MRYNHMRGQTFPLQIAGTLMVLLSAFLIYNWALVLNLQIQVQNDADAAAQLAVLPQITQFNQLQLGLYSANVEEYRLRTLMQSLLLNVRDSGGCDDTNTPIPSQDNIGASPTAKNCILNYPLLRQAYIDSVNRYTSDVELIEGIGDVAPSSSNFAPAHIIAQLQANCASEGDCSASYFLNTYTARERALSLGTVNADAVQYSFEGSDHGFHGYPNPMLTPITADVTACEKVSGLLPNFFGKTFGPAYIVARSAATPIAVTQEWFEPGGEH